MKTTKQNNKYSYAFEDFNIKDLGINRFLEDLGKYDLDLRGEEAKVYHIIHIKDTVVADTMFIEKKHDAKLENILKHFSEIGYYILKVGFLGIITDNKERIGDIVKKQFMQGIAKK